MTLVIAIQGWHSEQDGFIVVGCDSRGVVEVGQIARTELNKFRKLFKLNKHCCVLMAGDGEYGLKLIDEFKRSIKLANKNTSTIAKEFGAFCKKEFNHIDEFNLKNRKMFPDVDFIVAGMDREGTGFKTPRIYILRRDYLFYPSMSENFTSLGWDFLADYFFEKYYKDGIDIDSSSKLVAQAIFDTQQVNGNVGGDIALAVVDSKGFRHISAEDYYITWEDQEIRDIIHGP